MTVHTEYNMRARHYVFDRAWFVQWVARAGRVAKRVGGALVIASHIIGVPTAAVEVWFYVNPSPPTAPSWSPTQPPPSPFADA